MVIWMDFACNLCIFWVGVTQNPLPFNPPPSYVEVLILHLHWDYWAHAPRERWDVHVLNGGMNRGNTETSQEVGGFQCLITMVLEPGRQQQFPPKKRIHLRKTVDFVLKPNVFFVLFPVETQANVGSLYRKKKEASDKWSRSHLDFWNSWDIQFHMMRWYKFF